MLLNQPPFCCITCNRAIQQAIFNSEFYPNLLIMLSAFIVLGAFVIVLSVLAARRRRSLKMEASYTGLDPIPLGAASTVLGIGLGGFIDGIALHQILQWHEMLSNKIPATDYVGKSVNMFWDGIFHAYTFIVVCTGITLLWR